jgi:lysophospholipase L1-like esterase
MQRFPAADERLRWWAPRPPAVDPSGYRLDRFEREAQRLLAGRIGPLANLRSSAGCAVVFRTASPMISVHLDRLRHHQATPSGIDCELHLADGTVRVLPSIDLREQDGAMDVTFPTGLDAAADCWIWLPCISTTLIAGISLSDGFAPEAVALPEPRWLAIGDSSTQGFCVQSPTTCWVHRLSRRWQLPVWNLGVGGITIEPEVFAPALAARRWDLVTVNLGSNHSWRDSDAARAGAQARALAELLVSGGHRQVLWALPPWKPCEDGLGPPEFYGVPLDAAAGRRAAAVREELAAVLAPFAPSILTVCDLMPHDHHLLADGLHPAALGSAKYADNFARKFHPLAAGD